MAEDNKKLTAAEDSNESVSGGKSKSAQPATKGPGFFSKVGGWFVKVWNKLVKLCKDTAGELKKVVWTPRAEVIKSFKLVIAVVVAIAVIIAVIDLGSSWIINSVAGLVG